MKRGCLITFEGSEACGKSTQISLLADRLRSEGHEPLLCREPGGTPLGEQIRHLLQFAKEGHGMAPETELLLFSASRSQLLCEKILPALEAGQLVLCDRFLDSTTVYQGAARKLAPELIQAAHNLALGAFRPDLTLLLDLTPEVAQERLLSRSRPQEAPQDRMESEPPAFYRAVRDGYLALAQREPDRIRIVDAAGEKDAVAARIWQEVSRVLNR